MCMSLLKDRQEGIEEPAEHAQTKPHHSLAVKIELRNDEDVPGNRQCKDEEIDPGDFGVVEEPSEHDQVDAIG